MANRPILTLKKPKPKIYTAKDMTKWLFTTFPQTFLLKKKRPLKIGIHEDIIASFSEHFRALEVEEVARLRKCLHHALISYCRSFSYQVAITKRKHRIDLEGNKVQEIISPMRRDALKAIVEQKTALKQKTELKLKKQKKVHSNAINKSPSAPVASLCH